MSRIETIAEGVTLYLGDCREILPTIGKVDQPWNSAEAISANITGVLGFAVLAAPVGAIVGALSRRTLKRHLSGVDGQKVLA